MHRAITSNFGQYRVDLGRTSLSRRVRIYSSDRVPCATLCEVKSDVEAFRQASSVNLRGWKPNLAGDISGSYLRVCGRTQVSGVAVRSEREHLCQVSERFWLWVWRVQTSSESRPRIGFILDVMTVSP
jgi:hypothetical protein